MARVLKEKHGLKIRHYIDMHDTLGWRAVTKTGTRRLRTMTEDGRPKLQGTALSEG
jgi:hypothetical protein